MIRKRATYVALAVGTIAIGLVEHFHGAALGPVVRDMLGDALWAAMIVWWIGALIPNGRPSVHYGIAYLICVAVELSQLLHAPAIDAVRATRVGHLVLGSGFDPRDLLAYALGVVAAAVADTLIVSKRQPSQMRRGQLLSRRWRSRP